MLALLFALTVAVPSPAPTSTYVPIYAVPISTDVLKKPTAELREIAWMVGTWRCHVYSFATNGQPAQDFGVRRYYGKFVMENRFTHEHPWIFMEDDRHRDFSYYTFDPYAQQWVSVSIEWPISYGNPALGQHHGNTWTLVGDATVFGRKYTLRTTIVKKSNDAFSLVNEERKPDGTWLKDDEYDYTRIR